MRFLQQHTRPIARLLFCTAGAAMIEIAQNPQAIFDQLMRLVGAQVDEYPDTARAAGRPWAEQAKICFHYRGRCLRMAGPKGEAQWQGDHRSWTIDHRWRAVRAELYR